MYYVSKNGEQKGPYEEDIILACLKDGTFEYSDCIWKEGWADWKKIEAVFTKPNATPPPIPPLPSPTTTRLGLLTKKKEIAILLVIVAAFLIGAMFFFGPLFFMSPGGIVLLILCSPLFFVLRHRKPRDRGTEEDVQVLLSRAIKLESHYRIKDALAAYSYIAQRYAHTTAGSDAQKAIEQLQKKVGLSDAVLTVQNVAASQTTPQSPPPLLPYEETRKVAWLTGKQEIFILIVIIIIFFKGASYISAHITKETMRSSSLPSLLAESCLATLQYFTSPQGIVLIVILGSIFYALGYPRTRRPKEDSQEPPTDISPPASAASETMKTVAHALDERYAPQRSAISPSISDSNRAESSNIRAGKLSAKTLFLLSVGLLIIAFGVMAFAFSTNYNSKAAKALVEFSMSVIGIAGCLTWILFGTSTKRKRYAFISFSTICALSALVFLFSVIGGKSLSQKTSSQLAANLTEFAQQAADGDVPRVKPTGDAEIDPAFEPLNALSHDLLGSLNRMEDELASLQQEDVCSASVLGKKSSIEAEIGKRVAGQNIIERYRKAFPPMIESARAKFGLLKTSDEVKRGALQGFDNAIRVQVPQLEKMFALRFERENAESNFLRFMLAEFDDYRMIDKSISFKTPSNLMKYKELEQGILNAVEGAQALQKQQSDAVEAAKIEIKKLGK